MPKLPGLVSKSQIRLPHLALPVAIYGYISRVVEGLKDGDTNALDPQAITSAEFLCGYFEKY